MRAPAPDVTHIHGLNITRLIHENCGTLMTFALAQRPLAQLRERFQGEWKYLDKMWFELPMTRAERAALELAVHLRILDEDQKLDEYLRKFKTSHFSKNGFGNFFMKDGTRKPLSLREVSNKIIHSKGFEWNFQQAAEPKLICLPADNERWQRAEIELIEISVFCGGLMS